MNRHADESNLDGSADAERSRGPDLPSDPKELGKVMEGCRNYLLLVANQEIDPGLKTKAGASDIVQETFLEAQRDLGRFEGRSQREMKNWLRRILLNNVSNFIRRYRKSRKRQVNREVSLDADWTNGGGGHELAGSSLSPSGQAIRLEQEVAVERALGRLKERDRQVLIWRSQEHHAWDEIGRRLGGSPGMARKAWVRAVERLREEVGDLATPPSNGLGGR